LRIFLSRNETRFNDILLFTDKSVLLFGNFDYSCFKLVQNTFNSNPSLEREQYLDLVEGILLYAFKRQLM
jgi:hypothetical protein